MRYCLYLLLGLLLAGCAKPVQMDIPADHPANPDASAAPAVVQNGYIFHLPNNDLDKKSIPVKNGDVPVSKPAEGGMKDHLSHESTAPEKMGGTHAH